MIVWGCPGISGQDFQQKSHQQIKQLIRQITQEQFDQWIKQQRLELMNHFTQQRIIEIQHDQVQFIQPVPVELFLKSNFLLNSASEMFKTLRLFF